MHKMYKASINVLLFSCLALPMGINAGGSSHVHYNHYGYWIGESGSGEAMVANALVARPVGLVATVVGSAVYVVSFPFSLLGGNEEQARQKLVVEPTKFTFKRPFGEC